MLIPQIIGVLSNCKYGFYSWHPTEWTGGQLGGQVGGGKYTVWSVSQDPLGVGC